MQYRRVTVALVAIAALTGGVFGRAAAPLPERGDGVVAADHPLASAAGAEILRRGGNAVDAAVATALAAGVVQPAGSGLGGGGFAVVVDGDDRYTLDFREVAPAGATRDMYRTADGGVDPKASRDGGLAVAVPGEARGLAKLLATHGTMSPDVVAGPAIRLADKGFPLGNHLAKALSRTSAPEVVALFSVAGRLPRPGEDVRRPALARTLKKWAATGGEWLYVGDGAAAIARAVARTGGVLTEADLAAYTPVERAPLVTTWRGYTVVGMAPPSSGGVVVGQVLGVLDGYDLAGLGLNSSDYLHLLTEALKHAYADRAHLLGDPAFVDVPAERLVSPERIDEVRRAIWPGRTFGIEHYGPLIAPTEDAGTQHISVIDPQGRAVALTTTINTSFGSGVVVDELGIVLDNEMDDFAAAPGVPNAFGLVGNEANAIAPGKRPLSSMSPTVVLDAEGDVVMVVGGSGGSFIPSAVIQAIVDVVVFGLDAQDAVSVSRVHHQWAPDQLYVEGDLPKDVVGALTARGHTTRLVERFSAVQLVVRDGDAWAGGADPSKGGWPAAVWRTP